MTAIVHIATPGFFLFAAHVDKSTEMSCRTPSLIPPEQIDHACRDGKLGQISAVNDTAEMDFALPPFPPRPEDARQPIVSHDKALPASIYARRQERPSLAFSAIAPVTSAPTEDRIDFSARLSQLDYWAHPYRALLPSSLRTSRLHAPRRRHRHRNPHGRGIRVALVQG